MRNFHFHFELKYIQNTKYKYTRVEENCFGLSGSNQGTTFANQRIDFCYFYWFHRTAQTPYNRRKPIPYIGTRLSIEPDVGIPQT